jgi:hypothetical protein
MMPITPTLPNLLGYHYLPGRNRNDPSTIAVGAWNNGNQSSYNYYIKPGDLSLGPW